MAKNFKVGQEVWFRCTWVEFNHGFIKRFEEVDGHTYAHMKDGSATEIENVFATEQELIDDNRAKCEASVQEYKDSIKDVNDLVAFMYNTTVCCCEEYTDWDARRACRERAKELLDVDLGD